MNGTHLHLHVKYELPNPEDFISMDPNVDRKKDESKTKRWNDPPPLKKKHSRKATPFGPSAKEASEYTPPPSPYRWKPICERRPQAQASPQENK
jgi:hypothetical protein